MGFSCEAAASRKGLPPYFERLRTRGIGFSQLSKANRPDLTFWFSHFGFPFLVEVPKGDHLFSFGSFGQPSSGFSPSQSPVLFFVGPVATRHGLGMVKGRCATRAPGLPKRALLVGPQPVLATLTALGPLSQSKCS